MSKGDNTPGMSRLAGVIGGMVRKGQDQPVILDFGTIQSNYSLITNRYPVEIPASDYLICRCAGLPNSETVSSTSHTHTYEGDQRTGSASVRVDIARKSQNHVKPGDRVLVAWVDNDAVVIDIVYTATNVFEK